MPKREMIPPLEHSSRWQEQYRSPPKGHWPLEMLGMWGRGGMRGRRGMRDMLRSCRDPCSSQDEFMSRFDRNRSLSSFGTHWLALRNIGRRGANVSASHHG